MKRTSLPLFIISFLFLISSAFTQEKNKKKLEVFIESFEQNERIKNVDFELLQNGQELTKINSKKGSFSFVMNEGDGMYSIMIKKNGYLTKEVIFNTKNFPFEKKYDYQDLYIEFIPVKNENEANYVYRGEMTYEPESRAYKVDKVDSSMINLKKNYEKSLERLENVHREAVENGDALAMLEEFEYAKNFYELALEAEPDDAYSKEAVVKMDSLIIEKKQKVKEERQQVIAALTTADETPTEDSADTEKAGAEEVKSKASKKPVLSDSDYYSVQLGAFHDWYDESAFTEVPDLLVADGSDYKRVLSGRFNNREMAVERMNKLKQGGFPEAFVVTMNGEERIGF